MGVISGTLIGGLIAGLAKEIGAPLVEKIVARRLGPVGGELAGQVIRTIAEKAGVEPDRLPNLAESDLPRLEKAIVDKHWERAQWSELLPPEGATLMDREEDYMGAKEEELQHRLRGKG